MAELISFHSSVGAPNQSALVAGSAKAWNTFAGAAR